MRKRIVPVLQFLLRYFVAAKLMWRHQNVLQRFQHVLKWRTLQPREKITQNAFLILFYVAFISGIDLQSDFYSV